jgi:hypothetical protein
MALRVETQRAAIASRAMNCSLDTENFITSS